RGRKRTCGYIASPSSGTVSVANGTTSPMVKSLPMALSKQPQRNAGSSRMSLRSSGLQPITADISPLYQHRAHAARPFALAHDAEAFCDLGIGLNQAAEIAAKAVLV